MRPFVPFVVVALLILALLQVGWKWWKGYSDLQWPAVQGRIIAAKIEPTTRLEQVGPRTQQRVETYKLDVSYEYEVNGRRYQSRRYSYGTDSYTDYDAATRALEGMSPRLPVTVFYNPRDPADAVLKPGLRY